jgi:hypothetical protein
VLATSGLVWRIALRSPAGEDQEESSQLGKMHSWYNKFKKRCHKKALRFYAEIREGISHILAEPIRCPPMTGCNLSKEPVAHRRLIPECNLSKYDYNVRGSEFSLPNSRYGIGCNISPDL